MTDAEWEHCKKWLTVLGHDYASGAGTCVSEEDAAAGEEAAKAAIAEVEHLRARLADSEGWKPGQPVES